MLGGVMRRIASIALACVVAAACASAPEVDVSKGEIRADLKEYSVGLTSSTMRSGQVTFLARNVGGIAHSFIVIRTDLAADRLPVDGPKQVAKEDGKVGGLDTIDPGKSLNLRIQLPPGHYVVICNVPTHYQLGMRADLTVQ
jgi:hypothetical protein